MEDIKLTEEMLTERDGSLVSFVQGCMTENLNHARHVETEIHTFTGIYMAVVAGILAFDFSKGGTETAANIIACFAYLIIAGGGVLALKLVRRWYEVFDRHMLYAERAYYMLEAIVLRDKHTKDVIEIWNLSKDELKELADLDPIFAFRHPRGPKTSSTRKLVISFHRMILLIVIFVFVITLISTLMNL